MEIENQERSRAWFFIQVKKGAAPKKVANDIYTDHGGVRGGDHYVLVRADVVNGCPLGEIMASVDATGIEIKHFCCCRLRFCGVDYLVPNIISANLYIAWYAMAKLRSMLAKKPMKSVSTSVV